MYEALNQNDIDEIRLAVDKLKMQPGGFDAARKMEVLLEAHAKQEGGDSELERYQEAIELLPNGTNVDDYPAFVCNTADMLRRAHDRLLAWDDSKDDEPLDEAVKRLVQAVEAEDPAVAKMGAALMEVLDEAGRGNADSLSRIRELAAAALP